MSLAVIAGGKQEDVATVSHPTLGSKEWADHIREETKKLVHSIETDYLRLARNLWLIFDTPINGDKRNNAWWQKWGYGSIIAYAEQELGIHHRKAERLRRIWFVIGVELAEVVDEDLVERIVNLGFSKVRELVRPGVLTKKNVRAWITKAEKVNYLTLNEEIQAFLLGRTGVMRGTLGRVEPVESSGDIVEPNDDDLDAPPPTTPPQKTMNQLISDAVQEEVRTEMPRPEAPERLFYKNFAFYTDQWDTVKAAMERAQELSGSTKPGQNMSLICLDFLATNEFKTASMEQTQRFLIRIERALGVKLIAVTPKEHEIIFGYKLIDRLTKEG